jgi:3-methyladenine DNA glycosylase AlkD
MLSTRKTRPPVAKTSARKAAPAKVKPTAKAKKTQGEPMSLSHVMQALEKAGSEQTRKTYTRHGAKGPMFGVSFGTLSALQKRIRVDHELALKLWDTGNVDARNLAMKIAEPAVMKPSDLDRWARENEFAMCNLYIGSLASESPHGTAKAREWLASTDVKLRTAGWTLVGILADRDETTRDEAFAKRLEQIEKSIHAAPNEEKYAMNGALIAIGGRSAALRKAACAAAKRIGKVDVDHGDTACRTPDAVPYIEKMWARSQGKFPTPAAAERARESMRTRC